MERVSRHQCLIYSGAPSDHLKGLATVIRDKLNAGYRCLYLNSPTMVAGLRSCLSALDIDVADQITRTNLLLSSEQGHLIDGAFDPKSMLRLLEGALADALSSGYSGLWASGDMSWEFGPSADFHRLAEYEIGLEAVLQSHPELSGVCQYHSDSLPRDVMRKGLALHRALYLNETLSRINANYTDSDCSSLDPIAVAQLEQALDQLCGQ